MPLYQLSRVDPVGHHGLHILEPHKITRSALKMVGKPCQRSERLSAMRVRTTPHPSVVIRAVEVVKRLVDSFVKLFAAQIARPAFLSDALVGDDTFGISVTDVSDHEPCSHSAVCFAEIHAFRVAASGLEVVHKSAYCNERVTTLSTVYGLAEVGSGLEMLLQAMLGIEVSAAVCAVSIAVMAFYLLETSSASPLRERCDAGVQDYDSSSSSRCTTHLMQLKPKLR